MDYQVPDQFERNCVNGCNEPVKPPSTKFCDRCTTILDELSEFSEEKYNYFLSKLPQ